MMQQSCITLIANDPARVDPLAIDQLHAKARLDGINRVVGLPDLHASNGIAVGAAFWSESHIYPHMIGSDIGCGMALWETDLALRKFKLGVAERKLHDLDTPWEGDSEGALTAADLPVTMPSEVLRHLRMRGRQAVDAHL